MITGAAGGIGFATAQRFAEEGAMVMMADRQEAALTAARERLLAAVPGARVEIFVVDVVDSAGVAAMVAAVLARFGRIDCLVNNAGITRDARLVKMTDEQFDQVIDVNLNGSFYMSRAFGRVLVEQGQGGSIVKMMLSAFATHLVGFLLIYAVMVIAVSSTMPAPSRAFSVTPLTSTAPTAGTR